MRKSLRILIDLDDVLVDFVGSACKAHGTTYEEVAKFWELGRWDIQVPLGKALGRTARLPDEEFWIPLNVPNFWASLPEFHWTASLLETVFRRTDDWFIVSAPSRCDSSRHGKLEWFNRYFGFASDRFIPTRYKEIFAKKGVVLIDDSTTNIDKFNAEGGKGILFPKLWNGNHVHAADPLTYVRNYLEACK